jgi:hypothetical protein
MCLSRAYFKYGTLGTYGTALIIKEKTCSILLEQLVKVWNSIDF